MSLLIGRVTVTPTDRPKVWEMRGQGTPAGLFSRIFSPLGMASPRGHEEGRQWEPTPFVVGVAA
jgi:hypothetical protein